MPGRLPTLAMSGIWTAAIFLLGGLRRHRAPLILDRDMRHGVDQLPQEVDLRTLHQARHHDGEADSHGHAGHADQGLPHPGADMGPCDVEEKFHGGYRLLTDEVATRVIDDRIDVGGHGCRNHRIVGIRRRSGGNLVTAVITVGFGCCARLIGRFARGRRIPRPWSGCCRCEIRAPSARSLRAGESTVVPLDTSPMISVLRLPRMPTVNGHAPDPGRHRPSEPRSPAIASAGTTMADRLLAEDDVGLDRHADPQRRILRQPQIDAEGFAGQVALRRDLRHRGPQRPFRERLAAQKSLLAGSDAVDFFLVDFGNDLHRAQAVRPRTGRRWGRRSRRPRRRAAIPCRRAALSAAASRGAPSARRSAIWLPRAWSSAARTRCARRRSCRDPSRRAPGRVRAGRRLISIWSSALRSSASSWRPRTWPALTTCPSHLHSSTSRRRCGGTTLAQRSGSTVPVP